MHSTFKFSLSAGRVACGRRRVVASVGAVIALAASAVEPTTVVRETATRHVASPDVMRAVSQPKQRRAAVARVNGTCGEDDRSHRCYIPLKLCHSGIPGDFSGEGPWQWRCAGEAVGKSAWCSATYNGK